MIGKSMHRFPAALFAALTLASGIIFASGNPKAEQPAPAGGHEQHMMMPQAPMHEMPGMMGMEHGPGGRGMGGHDMSPVDVSDAPAAGPEARGGRLLEPTMRDGVKEFELTTGVVRWNILPDLEVGAYAYNGQVPGPLIRVQPDDRVRIRVRNDLPEATTVHWHGFILPIEQDGVPELSQPPIPPGGEHTYEFRCRHAGHLFLPHPFNRRPPAAARPLRSADHRRSGAAFGSRERAGDHARRVDRASAARPIRRCSSTDMLPNYFTFNGKSYPATETVKAKVGDRILFRLIGSGQFIHPIHIHGGPFEIVATDGNPVPEARA